MNISINPVHCEGLNCFEDIIVSLAKHFNIEYRLAFNDIWGFEFRPAHANKKELLGERVGNNKYSISKLLYKYCNLNVVKFDCEDPFELNEIVKEHLAKGIPIGTYIDAFWCPWLQGRYQRIHDVHHFLIIGIDDENNFNCIDPSIRMSICKISKTDFINGCKNCIEYDFKKDNAQPDYLEIFKDSINRLKDKKFYNDIKIFADEFRDSFDINEEYKNYNLDVWYVLIDRNFRLIASGRTLYAEFIELISEKLNSKSLLAIKYDLQKSSSNWNKIRGILTRSYIKGCTDTVKEKVYVLLNEISDFEKNLINKLNTIAEENLFEKDKAIVPDIKSIKQHYLNNSEAITLNLDEELNNRAFSVSENDTYKADITGIGNFFLCDGLENKGSIEVSNMYFKLPQLIVNKYDNVACAGQKINVKKSIYQSIMFLGWSDNGDFIEDVSIFFEDGEILEFPISFTDSWRLPKFNEAIAWTGRGGKWTDGKFEIHMNEQRIFAREEPITKNKVIEAIKLPDCSNVHIFAISLRKTNK